MVSVRRSILSALQARFAALPGWTVVVRDVLDSVNLSDATPKAAYIYDRGEDSETPDHLYYTNEMAVFVVIRARVEDADANAYDHVDSLLVELQKVIHTEPVDLGVAGVERVVQRGSTPQDPDARNLVGIEWRLMVQYRHNYTDPEVYAPAF